MQKHIKNMEKEIYIYIKNIQKVHMYKHRRNHPQVSRAQGGIISTTTLVCHFVCYLYTIFALPVKERYQMLIMHFVPFHI